MIARGQDRRPGADEGLAIKKMLTPGDDDRVGIKTNLPSIS